MVKPTEITSVLRCKVALCGDAAVGKTALATAYTTRGQDYPKSYKMTSGVEVMVATVQVPETTTQVELYLYDTSGNDLFQEFVPQLWGGVYYAIIVFDKSNPESFDHCKRWLELLKTSRPDKERALKVILVGTKCDLPPQRHLVSTQQAAEWAATNGMEYFETSAEPPGRDYDAPFVALAKQFQKFYEETCRNYLDSVRNY